MKPLKFIHIPKTGGTSIEDVGAEHDLKWGRFHKEYDPNVKWKITQVPPWHIFPSKLSKTTVNKYDWFTVVRNPYSLFVSGFHYDHTPQSWWGEIDHKRLKIKDHDIQTFNEYIVSQIHEKSQHSWGGHWAPQHKFTEGVPNLTILKFENLKEEFDELMKRYNLDIRLDKHSNSTQHVRKFSVEDLSHETINLINDVYRLDFEKFGYSIIKT